MNLHQSTVSAARSRYLRPEAAAEFLGKKPSTLAQWRSARVGPAYVKIGGSVHYLETDLEAFVAAARHEPSAA